MPVTKVLVVDDSAADLLHIRRILEDAGYMTLAASSGREAVATAQSQRPDLIFLDIIMQEMDGYEACRRLAKDDATRDIPVVFVTSKHQKADKVWAQMQGARAFITKPCTRDDILGQVSALP